MAVDGNFQMFTIDETEVAAGSLGARMLKRLKQKPAYRLSIVIDRDGQDPEWVEIAAFWPTKKGTGFTGRTRKSQVIPEGLRLVLTPASK